MSNVGKILATLSVVLLAAAAAPDRASAGAQDYRFEPVRALVETAKTSIVTVRLVHRISGESVADADIVEGSLRMPMPGTSAMAGRAEFVSVDKRGRYRFAVDVPMDGQWTLVLAARVPYETQVIRDVVFLYIEKTTRSSDPADAGG